MQIRSFVNAHINTFSFTYQAYFTFCHYLFSGNTKRAVYILQNAFEVGAKPKELLEAAFQSMQAGKIHLSCSEDKENLPGEFSFIFFLLKSKTSNDISVENL